MSLRSFCLIQNNPGGPIQMVESDHYSGLSENDLKTARRTGLAVNGDRVAWCDVSGGTGDQEAPAPTWRRVTAEDVIAAYIATGKKPAQGAFETPEGCCAASVLVYRKTGYFPNSSYSVAEILGLPKQYVWGFIDGYDGFSRSEDNWTNGPDYLAGTADGRRVLKSLQKLGFLND